MDGSVCEKGHGNSLVAVVGSFAHLLRKIVDFSSEVGGNVGGSFVIRGDVGNKGGKGWMMDHVLLLIVQQYFSAEDSKTGFYCSQAVLCNRVCC